LRWLPSGTVKDPRRWPLTVCGSVVALIASLPAYLLAGEPLPQLEYVAPPDCPDARAFLSLVKARTGGVWETSSPLSGGPRFAVDIRGGAWGAIGRLRRIDLGASAAREVTGNHCQEVVEALALTTALSLAEPPATTVLTGLRPAGDGAAAQTPSRQWAVGLGIAAWALLPRPMPGATLALDRHNRQWPARFTVASPDLRLSFFHGRNHLLQDPGAAGFELTGAGLDVCPAGASGGVLALRLCAIGQVGVLSGYGINVAQPRRVNAAWLATGLLGRLGLRLGRRVLLAAEAGAVVPLRRREFVFDRPRITVASVPAVVPQVGLSAALTIP
jgi:hypothetical protein